MGSLRAAGEAVFRRLVNSFTNNAALLPVSVPLAPYVPPTPPLPGVPVFDAPPELGYGPALVSLAVRVANPGDAIAVAAALDALTQVAPESGLSPATTSLAAEGLRLLVEPAASAKIVHESETPTATSSNSPSRSGSVSSTSSTGGQSFGGVPTPTSQSPSSGGFSWGPTEYAYVVVPVVLGAALVASVVFFLVRRHRKAPMPGA